LLKTGDNDWIWLLSALALLLAGAFSLGRSTVGRDREARRAGHTKRMRLVGSALVMLGVAIVLLANAGEIAHAVRQAAASVSSSTTAKPATISKKGRNEVIIPSAGIRTPIGTNQSKALEKGAYLQRGSARPGEKGNAVLAGHRRNKVFALLHRVEKGDIITVRYNGKLRRYKVAKKMTVSPKETKWIRRAGKERLTLYTCLPRYSGDKRTVVIAYQVRK
jgi:LPXTG-site transpeptidase (sortase) family protein